MIVKYTRCDCCVECVQCGNKWVEHYACDKCKEPDDELYEIDGEMYCKDCMMKDKDIVQEAIEFFIDNCDDVKVVR